MGVSQLCSTLLLLMKAVVLDNKAPLHTIAYIVTPVMQCSAAALWGFVKAIIIASVVSVVNIHI